MSAHAVAVFGVGTDPPPERRLPRLRLVICDVSLSTAARSACVIWPTFSSRVIRPSRSVTRCLTGSEASSYGSGTDAALWAAEESAEAVAARPGSSSVEPTAAAVSAPTRERAKRTFKMDPPETDEKVWHLNRLGDRRVKRHLGVASERVSWCCGRSSGRACG